MVRILSRRSSLSLAPLAAFLALVLSFDGRTASAADGAELRAIPLEVSAAAPLVAEPGGPPGLEGRVAAALAAAKSPDQPIPHPLSASAQAAPLASRLGKDVTLVRRPGVGTPMQIRGTRLHERVEVVQSADPAAADSSTATAKAFLRSNRD
ncbi:MAG TPA: hypothetical protein VIZ58_13255, partial [Thermoanaerobaculia bacterium]